MEEETVITEEFDWVGLLEEENEQAQAQSLVDQQQSAGVTASEFFAKETVQAASSMMVEENIMTKIKDDTIKVIIYKDILNDMYENDPTAFFAFIQKQIENKEASKLAPSKVPQLKQPKDLFFIPKRNPVTNSFFHETDIFFNDNKYYDNKMNVLLEVDAPLPNMHTIFQRISQIKSYYSELLVSDLGIWFRKEMTEFFHGISRPYDESYFVHQDGKTWVYYRVLVKELSLRKADMFMRDIQQLAHVNELKTHMVDGHEVYQMISVSKAQSKLIAAAHVRAKIRQCKFGNNYFFSLSDPWFIADYFYASQQTAILSRHRQQRDIMYLLSYMRSLEGRPAMISLRNWFAGLRIDGFPMCTGKKYRETTGQYKDHNECDHNKCYCYNPIMESAGGLTQFVRGETLAYLRIATDLVDKLTSEETGGSNLSIHFCDNRQALCPVCRQNAAKCFCALKPEDALRLRGLYNSNFFKHYVVLGKPAVKDYETSLYKVTFIPDLSQLVPRKRSHHVFCVPDSRNIKYYDDDGILSQGCKYAASYYSLPNSLYDHPAFLPSAFNQEIIDFVMQPFNKLNSVSEIRKRKTQPASNQSLLSIINRCMVEFSQRLNADSRKHNVKRIADNVRNTAKRRAFQQNETESMESEQYDSVETNNPTTVSNDINMDGPDDSDDV